MTRTEKMKLYIERTGIPQEKYERYAIRFNDIYAVYEQLNIDTYGAICLAFSFGMAKGYRAAKAKAIDRPNNK